MRWLGIAVCLIFLCLVGIYALGIFLPSVYVATVSRTYDAPRAMVWRALTDFEHHPVSGKMARDVVALEASDQQPAWVEDIGSSKIVIKTVEMEPEKFLHRRVTDKVVPLTADIKIKLRQENGQTTVSIANKTVVRQGTWHVPLFRLSLFFTSALEHGVVDYLDRLETDFTQQHQLAKS